MNLSEVVEYSKIQEADASFGDRMYEAFVTSWKNFANNAQDFAVWFIRAFPTLLVLASPGILAWIIVGSIKAKHRRKGKKLEKAAETAQDKTNTDQENSKTEN